MYKRQHQDRWGIGNALLPEHHREDIDLICELGATTVSYTHLAADDNDYPDAYAEFGDVTFVSDESALEGEEDLLNALNADSGLNINAGGKEKVQEIIEHASNGDMSYDDIMAEWNEKWTQAQEDNGVTAE